MSDLPKIAMFDMGDHLVLTPPKAGLCGFCHLVASTFITRGGHTRCIDCDGKHLEREGLNARITLEMMNAPVVIRCVCPSVKDPSELPKCMCPASDPENRT